jgi:hypothetical protein
MPNRTALAGVALLSALAVVAVFLTARAEIPAARRVTTPGADASAAQLRGRVAEAAAEARALVELGERRSRNLFAIRSAQRRMEEKLAAADAAIAFLADSDPDAAALAAYRAGAADVRAAMDEAQAGFLRLDWDRVAEAYDRMESGAARLEQAASDLGASLPASPVP